MYPADMFRRVFRAFDPAPKHLFDYANALKLPDSITLRAQTDGQGFDLFLYDVIGCGCCEPDDIAVALAQANQAPVRVRINSPGGDAFAGFAAYNLLNGYKGDLSVLVDGVCASAASYIAMAGDTISMQPASFMMIHNAWTISAGDRNQLQVQINALQRLDNAQTKLFSEKTGRTADDIAIMLDAETWFSSDEAVAAGFADDIAEQAAPLQSLDDVAADDGDLAASLGRIERIDGMLAEAEDRLEHILAQFVADDEAEFALEKRRRLMQARLLSRNY